MNGRLPGPAAFVLRFPRSPVERPQRFIQQPNFMILRNHVIERGLKERDLLPDNLWLSPPIRRRHRVPSLNSAPIPASSPRIARPYLNIQVGLVKYFNSPLVSMVYPHARRVGIPRLPSL
jgi:hypothetical protein